MKTIHRMRALWARCLSNQAGVAAVELALVITPFSILVLISFDLGYQAYLRSVVQGALNDVARSASMEAPDLDCTDATLVGQVQCAMKRRSEIIAKDATYNVTVTNYFDFNGVNRSEKLVTDHNNNGRYDTGDCFVDLNTNNEYDSDSDPDAEIGREGVGGADDVSYYEVEVSMPRIFPVPQFLPVSPQYQIRGQTAVRNQPYARQAIPPTVCV